MVTDGDNLNFAALCRGVDLLPAKIAKDLKCYLSSKADPYYKLHPLQVYSFLYQKEMHTPISPAHSLQSKTLLFNSEPAR
jgi:hypothetical protein